MPPSLPALYLAIRLCVLRRRPSYMQVNLSTWKILVIVSAVYVGIFGVFGAVYWCVLTQQLARPRAGG